jgi:hypothetical protein
LSHGRAFKGRDGAFVTADLEVYGAVESGVDVQSELQSDNNRFRMTYKADSEILRARARRDRDDMLRQILADAQQLQFVALLRDPDLPLPTRARRRVLRCHFPDLPNSLIKKLSSDLSKKLDDLIDELIPPVEPSALVEGFVRFHLEDKGENELFEHLVMRIRSSSSAL